jgi:serine/threonine-protein kinase
MSLIHRDLKPDNLMLANPGTVDEKIKIMDLGLSRLASVPHFDLQELRGGNKRVSGTPEYFSPEQSRGDDIDPRSDLYSLGLILFELLTGKRPFHGETSHDYMRAHAYTSPPSFAKLGITDVPPAIEAVVQRCLYKFAAERPYDADELAKSYERALCEKITVDVPPEQVASQSAMPPQPAVAPVVPRSVPGGRIYTLQAWMPERIAVLKLQGFLDGAGGEVVDSQPGLVRLRLPMKEKPATKTKGGLLAKLMFRDPGTPPPPDYLHVDIYMEQRDPRQPNCLTLTLVMRGDDGHPIDDRQGAKFCEKASTEICSFLMAKYVS